MKKAVVFGVTCLLVVVALSATSMAQGRGQGGGGGGGRGGMGRGMSRLMLLRAESVQKALDLSDDKVSEIQAIMEDVMPGVGGGGGGGGGRPDPEAMAGAEKEIMGLLDDKQKKRLLGIFAQASGARALVDADVAKELKIDDDLKEEIQGKLDDMATGMREKMQGIMEETGGDRQAAMAKMQELRAEMDKEVLALLSDSQKKALEELKGEKVELPMMGGGGRGGQGGGGRGGQGGGGQGGGRGGQGGGGDGGSRTDF